MLVCCTEGQIVMEHRRKCQKPQCEVGSEVHCQSTQGSNLYPFGKHGETVGFQVAKLHNRALNPQRQKTSFSFSPEAHHTTVFPSSQFKSLPKN